MSVRDNLIAARALIDTPEKWLKGSLQKGRCFCIVGAIGEAREWDMDAYITPEHTALSAALLVREPHWADLHKFNDAVSTSHADIMALFDRALEAAGDK